MTILPIIRDTFWKIHQDSNVIASWLISTFPGKTGYKLRTWWWKHRLKSCGKQTYFALNTRIQNPRNCTLGDNVILHFDCYLNASGGLFLGDNVCIGERVKIWTDNHLFTDPDKPFMLQGFEFKNVTIGDDCNIGACSFIKPGITIGKRCTLLPGSILYKSIPDDCIVAGNPAIIVSRKKQP